MTEPDTIAQTVDTLYLPYVMPLDSAAKAAVTPSYSKGKGQLVSGTQGKGLMGTPAHYKVGTDDVLSVSVVIMVLVAILALSSSMGFVVRQGRNFFFRENDRTTTVPDTNKEIWSQVALVGFTTVMFALFYYAYTMWVNDGAMMLVSRYQWLAWCLLVFVLYQLAKMALYQWVNWVFFDGKEIEQWNKAMLFVTALEGCVATPVILLFIYGQMPLLMALSGVLIVIFLCKIFTFYKCYLIFFKRIGAFLQIFLYFCALELIPLAVLVGVLEVCKGNLIINF